MSSSADQQNPRQTITSNLLPAESTPPRSAGTRSDKHKAICFSFQITMLVAEEPGISGYAFCWHSVTGITCPGFCGQTTKNIQNAENYLHFQAESILYFPANVLHLWEKGSSFPNEFPFVICNAICNTFGKIFKFVLDGRYLFKETSFTSNFFSKSPF